MSEAHVQAEAEVETLTEQLQRLVAQQVPACPHWKANGKNTSSSFFLFSICGVHCFLTVFSAL
jgi:hypothetical protein